MVINVFDLSIKDLYYVLTLAEERHFTRAAEKCLVSQPALTKQIKNIETLLEIKIFERNNRKVLLTSRGEEIVKQAKKIIDESQNLINIANTKVKPLTGNFNLGLIFTVSPYLMPRILSKLIRRFPDLKLTIKEGFTHNLLYDLENNKLDAAITSLPIDNNLFTYEKLYFEPFVLAHKNSEALNNKKYVGLEDINPDKLLLLEEGNCLSDQTWSFCLKNKKNNKSNYHATSLDMLTYMIAMGLGYSIFPKLASNSSRKLNGLISYEPFKSKNVGRDIVIVYRKNYSNLESIRLLKTIIQENIFKTLNG